MDASSILRVVNFILNLIIIAFLVRVALKIKNGRRDAIKSVHKEEVSNEDAYDIDEMLWCALLRDKCVLLPDLKYISLFKTGCKAVPYVLMNGGYISRSHWLRPRLDKFYEDYLESENRSDLFTFELELSLARQKAKTL